MIDELLDSFESIELPEQPFDSDPLIGDETDFLPVHTESFVNTDDFNFFQPVVNIEDYVNTNPINEVSEISFNGLHNPSEIEIANTPFDLQTDNLQVENNFLTVDNTPIEVDNTPLSILSHPSFTGDSFYENKVSGAYKSMVDNVNKMNNALEYDNIRDAKNYAKEAGYDKDSLRYWEEAKIKADYREAMWDLASIDRVEQIYKKK